jgi:hypothetical protein
LFNLLSYLQFEVEMQDNWYEAVVSRQVPHRILSVVDWASDAPVPEEPVQRPPATYNVFPYGVNDPSEGDRSFAREIFDPLASPLGWHTIPIANDPLSSNLKSEGSYSNYTTTVGNNVCISSVPPQACYSIAHRCLLTRIGRVRLAGSTITGPMAAKR